MEIGISFVLVPIFTLFKMTKYDLYILTITVIVFVSLTVFFAVLIGAYTKKSIRLISYGDEDEPIYEEYLKSLRKRESKFGDILNKIISTILCAVVLVIFAFSVMVKVCEIRGKNVGTGVRVVTTTSMESKNEKNSYLTQNGLNDQFSAFDLIVTHELPKEEDLKLYDIVVYEVDGVLLVHRIVGIEERNPKHPTERWFLLQGDAVPTPDRFPVKYSQMKAIYRGKHVPFVGSFVLFLQSPAGLLCVLLFFVCMIGIPALENQVEKARKARLEEILAQRKKMKQQDGDEKNQAAQGAGVMLVGVPVYCNYARCEDCLPDSCDRACPHKFGNVTEYFEKMHEQRTGKK